MRTGYLVYDGAGAERNRAFAENLIKNAEYAGINLELLIAPFDESAVKAVDFAIVRAIAPQNNAFFESRGVR